MFLGHHAPYFHLYPFSHQNIHFSQKKMRFLTPSHKHIVFTLFIEKKPPKYGYTRKQPTHFLWDFKTQIKKKNFFRIPKILKLGTPKKMTPKSQAKNETPIPAIPIFNYFLTLKKYHANK